jgi:hypothetical protein
VLVRNASAEPARTELRLARTPNAPVFFMDAVSGAVRAADRGKDGWTSIELAARDSVFVVSGLALAPTAREAWPVKWLSAKNLTSPSSPSDATSNKWLAPWTLEMGRYRTTVELAAIDPGVRYVLDLGRVFHAADVAVNGEAVAQLLFSPFVADVTAALRAGSNTIEVEVRSPLLNRFIGYAEKGDPRYARFAKREPLATGLLGPVVLRIESR